MFPVSTQQHQPHLGNANSFFFFKSSSIFIGQNFIIYKNDFQSHGSF